MQKWLEVIKLVMPIVLGTVNPALIPLAGIIAHGIGAAEAMPGATGEQKLASVVDLATTAAQGINSAAEAQGKGPLVDPALVQATAADAISTAVQVANLIKKTPIAQTPSTDSTASQK